MLPPHRIHGMLVKSLAEVTPHCRWTGRCRHYKDGRLLEPVPHLAIVAEDDQFLLLHCDSAWLPVCRTSHESVDAAKQQAAFEYEGVDGCWQDLPESKSIAGAPKPAVAWSGHLSGYSGYAKANREILYRLANAMEVQLLDPKGDRATLPRANRKQERLDWFRSVIVPDAAPLVHFFGPDLQVVASRHRVCWTMMETYSIHPDMVRLLNENFDELWTPTEWNRRVFLESGVRVPSHVMPLGVNPVVFRRISGARLPSCRLLTGDRVGMTDVPKGFIFLSVGLPSFRKGFDVLIETFERVFGSRSDVHLVLGLTHSYEEWNRTIYSQCAGKKGSIWSLEGKFSEHEMAEIYSASDCYVSASRGEGWNLPLCEAAACGTQVIAPDNTSHPEVLRGHGVLFPTDGFETCQNAETVSKWYRGMPFSVLGSRSREALAQAMESVEAGKSRNESQSGLRALMSTRWSWDKAAERVAKRLLCMQR